MRPERTPLLIELPERCWLLLRSLALMNGVSEADMLDELIRDRLLADLGDRAAGVPPMKPPGRG